MTTRAINRAIRHLGLEIIHQRGSGYSYFLSLAHGGQVGESVYVCYLNQLTVAQWVLEAENAVKHI